MDGGDSLTLKYPRKIQHIGRWMIGWILSGLERLHPVAQYQEKDISRYFWVNGTAPDSTEYKRHITEGFKNYHLNIGGLVEKPVQISLAQLRAIPKHEQITSNYCIQGWTGVAKWGGVRMKDIMNLVQPKRMHGTLSFTLSPMAQAKVVDSITMLTKSST